MRLLTCALTIILITTLASMPVNPTSAQSLPGAIDQQCAAIGNSHLAGIGTHQPAGQTFIPSQSSLTAFALYLESNNPTPTSLTANIVSNGIAGVNNVQGSVVGTVTFTVPAMFGQPNGAWFDVTLPSGVILNPGTVYAINLVDKTSSSGINWSSCGAPYGNGCGYSDGQCQASSWAFVEYYGDFSLAFSTSGISIAQGASGTVNLYVASLNNFASPISLTFTAPLGVSASFNGPSEIETSAASTSSSTFTIQVAGTVATGTYTVTVKATSGGITHSATLQLIVTSASMAIANSPSVLAPVVSDVGISFTLNQPSATAVSLTPSSSQSATILLSSANGTVIKLASGWDGTPPTGVTVSLPTSVTLSSNGSSDSTLTFTTDNSPLSGNYTLLVIASNGAVSNSTRIPVRIVNMPAVLAPVTTMSVGDFAITPTADTVSTIPGSSGGTSLIVNSEGGFSASVSFAVSWVGNVPTGIGIFVPQTVTPPAGGEASSPISFSTTAVTPSGTYILQVTATSGSISHSTDITLVVNSPSPF